ncbi:MAG: type II toxin-antitoxin system PemK/MazF family toxin [Calditrichota bacterium]
MKTGSRMSLTGRIVSLSFPFDDLHSVKTRPALCLTEVLGIRRQVVVAFITSQSDDPPMTTDIVLDPASAEFKQTGLKVLSILRLHRLATVSDSIFRRNIGAIPETSYPEIRAKLRNLFKL